MAQVQGKRENCRHRLNSPLIYWMNLSGPNYRAEKLNHSDRGISFKSDLDLNPNTVVYIQREGCPPTCPGSKACESCRMGTFATVQWCQQHEDNRKDSYLIGAKYFEYAAAY